MFFFLTTGQAAIRKEKVKIPSTLHTNNSTGNNQIPEKIIGANDVRGELMFKIKYIGTDKMGWMKASVMNVEYPQLVIDFHQSNLVWKDDEP